MTGGAAAVIFDDDGRVLLIKENYGKRRWSLPGGAIERGESAEEAVVRETREETGVEVAIDFRIATYELDNGFEVHAFRCTISSGTPTASPTEEIAAVEWHPAHDLPSPRSNVLHYAVPDALRGTREVVRRGVRRLT